MSSRSRRKQAAAPETPSDAEMVDAPPTAVKQEVVETDVDGSGAEATAAEDAAMGAEAVEEGLEGEDGLGLEEHEEEPEAQRVRLLPGSTPTAASFEFLEEGHTLGNALRYIIMKNPDVEFCAYAIPHPAEFKMNLRIQTYGSSVFDVLEKGLRDLQDMCDVVGEKFWQARNDFAGTMQA